VADGFSPREDGATAWSIDIDGIPALAFSRGSRFTTSG
jgi:hypothetical protein